MAGSWSVDPDRVAGILSLVDQQRGPLEDAVRAMQDLAHLAGALKRDGRKTVALAFEGFIEEREDVPGKFIAVICDSANAASDAAFALLMGDADMESSVNAMFNNSNGFDLRGPAYAYDKPEPR